MSRVHAASVAEWAEACSTAFVPLKVRAASPRFAARLDHVELARGVSVTRVASEASEVYRNERVIADSPRDDVLLSVHRRGLGSIVQHDREARLRDGAAALYDASAPYVLNFPRRMSETVLQLPRGSVSRSGNSFEDLTARVLPASTSMNALSNLLWSIDPTAAPVMNTSEDELVADAIVALLQAVLLPAARPAATRLEDRALERVLRGYIEEHLTDPELGPQQLAAAHHVSIRLVHKVFAAQDDSPAAYIRRRRLEFARALLSKSVPVATVSYQSGFSDPDTFRRAFKRQFGESPSQLHQGQVHGGQAHQRQADQGTGC